MIPQRLIAILNKQFSSVFTIDNSNTSFLFALDGHPHPDVPPIHIDIAGVTTLLHNLDLHKVPGPNRISSKFLKETTSY